MRGGNELRGWSEQEPAVLPTCNRKLLQLAEVAVERSHQMIP